MKIIFLDIDGVLNHQIWFKEQKDKRVEMGLDIEQNFIDTAFEDIAENVFS